MNPPKTSTGKPCKLCLKKGGPCHLHSRNSPKKGFVKKTPKAVVKKKSSPKMVLDAVPLPALQEILLNLDRAELYDFCSQNKQAYKICSQQRFRMLYEARHADDRQMIYGELEQKQGVTPLVFQDAKGNILTFDDRIDTMKISYTPNLGPKSVVKAKLILQRKSIYDDHVLKVSIPLRGAHLEVKDILSAIGKEKWAVASRPPVIIHKPLANYKETELSKKAAEEFLKIVKRFVGDRVSKYFFKKKNVALIKL